MADDRKPAVEVQHAFSVRPETVFDAWLDPFYIAQWMLDADAGQEAADLDVDAREGAGFRFRFSENGRQRAYAGEYLKIRRPHELEFTWRVDQEADVSVVHVRFEASGSGTRLTLRHRFDALDTARAGRVRTAWEGDFARMSAALGRRAGGGMQ